MSVISAIHHTIAKNLVGCGCSECLAEIRNNLPTMKLGQQNKPIWIIEDPELMVGDANPTKTVRQVSQLTPEEYKEYIHAAYSAESIQGFIQKANDTAITHNAKRKITIICTKKQATDRKLPRRGVDATKCTMDNVHIFIEKCGYVKTPTEIHEADLKAMWNFYSGNFIQWYTL